MNSVEKAFFEFCKKFNRLPDFSETYNGQPIGRWRWRISNLIENRKLPQEIIEKLHELPLQDFYSDSWYSHYEDFEYSVENQLKLTEELKLWLEKQSDLFQEFNLPEEKIGLLDNLPVTWLNLNGSQRKLIHTWFQRYQSLKCFYSKYRELPSNKRTGKAEFKFDLYDWLNRQRKHYRSNKLKKRQIDLLGEVELEWQLNEVEKSFYSKLKYLKSFYSKHKSYPDSDSWLIDNRMTFRRGKLPDWKIKEFEKLPDWQWEPREVKFDKSFQIVREFLKKHKRAPRIGESWKGINISSWIISARNRYKPDGIHPNEDKAELLESLPYFSWDRQAEDWQKNYEILKIFISKYNRYPIPKETFRNCNIGSWIGTQRARFKKGTILEEEVDLLKSLPNWSWSPFDDIWNEKYQTYLSEEKSKFSEESIKWARKQRARFKAGKLESHRITLLENLPDWTWFPHEDQWQKNYCNLLKYVQRKRHFPSSKSKLGTWVYNQIFNYNCGTLSKERISKLKKVPDWKWKADGKLLKN